MKNKQGLFLWESNQQLEVGLDECARGCLLGRTYTAAVMWSPEFLEEIVEDDEESDFSSLSAFRHSRNEIAEEFSWIHKIKDSKQVSEKNRNFLSERIKEHCLDYSIVWADEKTIDQKNILQAVQGCFHECLNNLQIVPDKIFVDGTIFNNYYDKDFNLISHTCIEKGDNTYFNIASASILAKVAHDKYIEELCIEHPELTEKYDIGNNMGYGTAKHMEGIKKYGITDFHRKTFGICKSFF
jgi:ribonuclease HII